MSFFNPASSCILLTKPVFVFFSCLLSHSFLLCIHLSWFQGSIYLARKPCTPPPPPPKTKFSPSRNTQIFAPYAIYSISNPFLPLLDLFYPFNLNFPLKLTLPFFLFKIPLFLFSFHIFSSECHWQGTGWGGGWYFPKHPCFFHVAY